MSFLYSLLLKLGDNCQCSCENHKINFSQTDSC